VANHEKGERARPEHSAVGVLVVDDQLIFRHVAHDVINMTDGFELLGHATSGSSSAG
jgi:chemotaxis response regulator CheB